MTPPTFSSDDSLVRTSAETVRLGRPRRPTKLQAAGYLAVFLVGNGSGFALNGSEFVLAALDRAFPENQPPQATIKVAPKEGKVPLTVMSLASDSSDPEGHPLTYRWFVDEEPIAAHGRVYQHTFTRTGTHAIAVEVKDKGGLVNTADEIVEVDEKYDSARIVESAEEIDRLLREGDLVTALDMANRIRYTCVQLPIPKKECAEFHAHAADAQLHLGRYEEGFISISTATDMMPGDVFHMVTQSEFRILRSESENAIIELTELANKRRIGDRGLLYLGIAHAMEGNYGKAETHLERVKQSMGRFQSVAAFTLLVTEVFEHQTASSVTEQHMKSIVCVDESLLTLFRTKSRIVERHIIILRVLIGGLDEGLHGHLRTTMEAMTCT